MGSRRAHILELFFMRNALKWVGIVFLPVLILSFISFPHEAVAATAPNALQHLGPVLFVGAIGKASDMVIYQEEFQAGMVEKIGQYLGVFNAGSRGAIQLVPNILKG
ncbi:MAG: major capsid protein, partial [Gemmatimonas sp.]